MTKFKEWPDLGEIDVVCGGTPCQSFSVAGLRKGLEDPRGNLMLTFMAILDKYKPKFVLWENVPGVISSNEGADFALFLDGLEELGYIADIDIHDAQFFGLAQRRRRVFVCAQSRDFLLNSKTISSALTISQCLAEILVLILAVNKSLSATGLRGLAFDATKPINSLQRRMRLFGLQKEEAALMLQKSLDVLQVSFDCEQKDWESLIGKNGQEDSRILGDTEFLKLSKQEAWRAECRSTGLSLSNTLEELLQVMKKCTTLTSKNEITESTIYFCAKALLNIAAPITQSMQSSPSFWSATLSISTALKEFMNYARSQNSDLFTDVGGLHDWNDFIRQASGACQSFGSFRARQHTKEVFPITAGLRRDLAPSRETGQEVAGTIAAGAGDGGQPTGVAPTVIGNVEGGAATTLSSREYKGLSCGRDGMTSAAVVYEAMSQAIPIHDQATRFAGKRGDKQDGKGNGLGIGEPGAPMNTLTKGDRHAVATQTAVRRLTPVECERLQGFPDDYTNIPWRKQPTSPDGPRYKALGNSWAVPNVRWIGVRIDQYLKTTNGEVK
jgi:DNA-cytosine methyltransferase